VLLLSWDWAHFWRALGGAAWQWMIASRTKSGPVSCHDVFPV
jgi:hypothetical protein